MMDSTSSRFLLAASFFLVITACAPDKKKSDPAKTKPPVEQTRDVTPAGDENSDDPAGALFEQAYEYNSPGSDPAQCSTGKHTFKSDRPEVTLSRFCEALRDENLNAGCAKCMRLRRYQQECAPSPEDSLPAECQRTAVAPAPPETQLPATDDTGPTWQLSQFNSSLGRLWSEKRLASPAQVAAELGATLAVLNEAYGQCGYKDSQPACHDFYVSWKHESVLNRSRPQALYLVSQMNGFYYKGQNYPAPLVQIVELKNQAGELKAQGSLKVYPLIKPLFGDELTEFVIRQNQSSPSLEIFFAEDSKAYALESLTRAESLTELYHKIRYLMEESYQDQAKDIRSQEILAGLNPDLDAFLTDVSIDQQITFFKFLETQLVGSEAKLRDIAQSQLKSPERDIQLLAACHAVLYGLEIEVPKELLHEALKHSHPRLRERALLALSQIELTQEDEKQILREFANSKMRTSGFELAKGFQIGEAHLPELRRLAENEDHSTKLGAIELISQSPSAEATELLITQITNSSTSVRELVLSRLEQRTLTASNQQSLSLRLRHNDPQIRLGVLRLLAAQPGEYATGQLLGVLTDSSQILRQTSFEALQSRVLSDQHLGALNIARNSSYPDTKLHAIELIAGIPTDKATSLLILSLKDEFTSVRALAVAKLKQRKIGSVTEVKDVIEGESADVDRAAVELLGQIPGIESELALISSLSSPSSSTRERAYQSLSSRPLNDAHLAELESLSTSKEWDTRYKAISLIGLIQTRASTAALIRSLADSSESISSIAFALLSSRSMDRTDISALAQLLSSDKAEVRMRSAELLGRISSPRAKQVLEERREVETSEAVKARIDQALAS